MAHAIGGRNGVASTVTGSPDRLTTLHRFASTVHRPQQQRPVLRPRPRRLCTCEHAVSHDGLRRRRCPRCAFLGRTFADVMVDHLRNPQDTYGVPPETPSVFRRRHEGVVGRPSRDIALYGVSDDDVTRARTLAAMPKTAWVNFNQRQERQRRHGYAPAVRRRQARSARKCRAAQPLHREHL